MKAKIYSANVKGTFTQIKAYYKANAVNKFQKMDSSIRESDVRKLNVINSHQTPCDSIIENGFDLAALNYHNSI